MDNLVHDRVIAFIRTAVPALIGGLIAQLIARFTVAGDWIGWIDQQLEQSGAAGVTVVSLLSAAGAAAAIAGWYALGTWLGKRWPKVEALMLGSSRTPHYEGKHAGPPEVL